MDIVFYIEIGGGGSRNRGTAHVGSFGEREHALSFAHMVRQAGYRPRFVVGPLIADHISLAGFEPEIFSSPEEGAAIVKEIDPALVIGCELFNLSAESARALIDLGLPMGTIDGTSLSVPINTDPFDTPRFARSLVLPDEYYAFRPCPVNDAGPDTERLFHWSLFPDAGRVPKDPQRYAALGLDPSRVTVMLPIAPWAMGSATIFGLDQYYQLLVERIVDGLTAIGQPVDLVFISLCRPSSLTVERAGGVTVHYPGLMPYDMYDHLLCSCDGIVTDNIISTSVSKAVVMGTPHLVIQNLSATAIPYPCNMFPLKVLFPAEREYAQAVETAECADRAEIRQKIAGMLRRDPSDAAVNPRRQAYLERLRGLAHPGDILTQIIGRPEPAEAGV